MQVNNMIKKLISSILKVTASENLDLEKELKKQDSNKSISQLLHEQENQDETKNTEQDESL